MKKLLALIILAAALYFGGMNDQTAVIVSVLCLLIVFLVSFIFSRVMKRFVSADLPVGVSTVYKNTESVLKIKVFNSSRVPLSRAALSMRMKYKNSRTVSSKRFRVSAPGGECESEIFFTPPYCGIIEARIKKIRIYDYLYMFSCSKKLGCKSEIYILPPPRELRIIMPDFGAYTANAVTESSSDKSGEDHSEIRLVREYRDGDLMRHIHRNYSARSGKLWIKEYYRDNDRKINVYLNTSSKQPLSADLLDAYYELVSSVLTSCVKYGLSMRINWLDAESGQAREYELRCSDDVSALLAKLYCTNTACSPEAFAAVFGDTDSGMVLSASLQWIFGGVPVFTFDKKTLSAQLESRVFVLGR